MQELYVQNYKMFLNAIKQDLTKERQIMFVEKKVQYKDFSFFQGGMLIKYEPTKQDFFLS